MTLRPKRRFDTGAARVPSQATAASSNRATMEISTAASRAQTLWIGDCGRSSARRSTITNPPPRARPIIRARNIQPIGDWLNACRLLKKPLRVRKVAKLHKPKVAVASARAVFFSDPRYCQAIRAWISAVPVSQGISEPFSTGSQAQ